MRVEIDYVERDDVGRQFVVVITATSREARRLDRMVLAKPSEHFHRTLGGLMLRDRVAALQVALSDAQRRNRFDGQQHGLVSRLLGEDLSRYGIRYIVTRGIDWKVLGLRFVHQRIISAEVLPSHPA